ncbi:MAG: hypothetical protein ACK53Y_23915, partial [bacterium]
MFGCRYYARKKGDRPHKLDYNTSMGVFLGYTGTAKNVYYYDLDTKRIKTSTHGIFDEANITVPQAERSVASQALIALGYKQDEEVMENQNISQAQPIARIQLRSPTATMPTQGSVLAAGYDVYSTVACDIKPQAIQKVPLSITIIPPQGTYIQLHSKRGLASKGIIVYAGVIHPDYRGDITVLLYNSSNVTHSIKPGDRIAQLIFHNIETPVLLQEETLNTTERTDPGLGNTDQAPPAPIATIHQTIAETLQPVKMPYNIFLSTDPFDDTLSIMVKDFGSHETMGMVLEQCEHRNRPRLCDILPSQPRSRIKNWRSTIRNGYIIQIEEHITATIDDIKIAIQKSRDLQLPELQIQIALDIKPAGIHPVEGLLQLFVDQLHIIHNHLQDIRMQNLQHLPIVHRTHTHSHNNPIDT